MSSRDIRSGFVYVGKVTRRQGGKPINTKETEICEHMYQKEPIVTSTLLEYVARMRFSQMEIRNITFKARDTFVKRVLPMWRKFAHDLLLGNLIYGYAIYITNEKNFDVGPDFKEPRGEHLLEFSFPTCRTIEPSKLNILGSNGNTDVSFSQNSESGTSTKLNFVVLNLSEAPNGDTGEVRSRLSSFTESYVRLRNARDMASAAIVAQSLSPLYLTSMDPKRDFASEVVMMNHGDAAILGAEDTLKATYVRNRDSKTTMRLMEIRADALNNRASRSTYAADVVEMEQNKERIRMLRETMPAVVVIPPDVSLPPQPSRVVNLDWLRYQEEMFRNDIFGAFPFLRAGGGGSGVFGSKHMSGQGVASLMHAEESSHSYDISSVLNACAEVFMLMYPDFGNTVEFVIPAVRSELGDGEDGGIATSGHGNSGPDEFEREPPGKRPRAEP